MKSLAFLSITILTLVTLIVPSPVLAQGATQFSGVAFFAGPGECTDPEGAGANYAVVMTGDLQGCHYSFIETSVMSPSGAYNETGHEVFVGTYNGQSGTFETTYRFTAKYTNSTDFIEVEGRCQHPIINGSGTGVFEGLTGRLDMRDNVIDGVPVDFPYRGHLK